MGVWGIWIKYIIHIFVWNYIQVAELRRIAQCDAQRLYWITIDTSSRKYFAKKLGPNMLTSVYIFRGVRQQCLSNLIMIKRFEIVILWLRDFSRSDNRKPYFLENRGTDYTNNPGWCFIMIKYHHLCIVNIIPSCTCIQYSVLFNEI